MDRILETAVKAGIIVLRNGGETYRCEEIMCTVAAMLGAENVSAFVTPTVIMLTCTNPDGRHHTHFKRILYRTINLGKITMLETEIQRLVDKNNHDPIMISNVFRRIENAPDYPDWAVVLAIAFGSMCFSLLFGGSLSEALAAFAVGAVMRIVLVALRPLEMPGFLTSIIGGFIISVLTALSFILNLIPSIGNVSISVLMTLVPGVILVNAIRDIIAGDLVAGAAKLLEAFVIAAALSIGAALGLIPFPSHVSYISAITPWENIVPALITAFFVTAAFGYFFYINKYDIITASVIGAAGWVVFLILHKDLGLETAGYFVSALFVAAAAEICASILKKPATIFIIPGIIPFVPGGGIYETMLYSLWGNMELAAVTGFRTLTAAGAIAAGIALVSAFYHMGRKIRA